MPWHDVDKFLKEVCSYVKYRSAHSGIKDELQDHISDRVHDYVQEGIDEEEAIKRAVEAMGDAEEIGKELNRQHKPYLGWALSLVNTLIVVFGLFTSLVVISVISSFFEPFGLIPNSKDIEYSINLKEKSRIDDRIVVLKKLIVDKNDSVYIRVNDYNNPFSLGWSMIDFQVHDDKGNEYHFSSGQSKQNFLGKRYLHCFDNLSKDATKIILDYDHYNRKIRFEIPLFGGDTK